jgi:hypothetical protein
MMMMITMVMIILPATDSKKIMYQLVRAQTCALACHTTVARFSCSILIQCIWADYVADSKVHFFLFLDADNEDDNSVQSDTDGWTKDGIVALCELNIPLLSEYNSGNISVKRRHWKKLANKMKNQGFVGDSYSSIKLSRKWRYLFTHYKKVKDNNGKTGRGRMKFKYYDDMHRIFRANEVESAVIDPDFLQPHDDAGISVRKRGEKTSKEDHNKLMREIQQKYNEDTLRLQREALDVEKEKINLLKELLARK